MKKRILIWGLAKSGRAAFNLIYNKLDSFFLFDDNPAVRLELSGEFEGVSNVFIVEKLDKKTVCSLNKIIISPSISVFNPLLVLAKKQGVRVVSELEEGFLHSKKKVVAVTGTNGKTTTATLIHQMLRADNRPAELVGNVGVPFCSRVKSAKRRSIFVCETSSFQLEASENFHPKIACLINLSADHLDRHKSMKKYFSVKKKIFQNLTKRDFAVVNARLEEVEPRCKTCLFSTEEMPLGTEFVQNRPKKPSYFCFVKNEKIVFVKKNKSQTVASLSDFCVQGRHNLENVLCAVCVAKILKVKNKSINYVLKNFPKERHKMEKVFEKNGVEFFDDSKATNVSAAVASMETLSQTHLTMLILGGADKGFEFDSIFENIPQNVFRVLAVGQTKDKIFEAAKRHNQQGKVTCFHSLKEAVAFACRVLRSGERLLLAPACSSFDEFENYADRGEKFLEYVKASYESC